MSYKVKIIEKKDPIVKLKASKLNIKNLFIDLLNETKGFKYQVESQYINISIYRSLSGSSYMDLPDELKSPRKVLINIKSKDKKNVFLWCHVRHINSSSKHPERIYKTDKKIVEELNYDEIESPVQEKDFNKTKVKNIIFINVFGYENRPVFPIYFSDKKFKDSMDLLLLIGNDKSNYVYIKEIYVSQNKN